MIWYEHFGTTTDFGWKACDHLLMNAWFSLMKVNYLHVLSWVILNFDTNCLLILNYR